jgi:hypothetical protein
MAAKCTEKAQNVSRSTIFKVLGHFPVDQIVVTDTSVLLVLTIPNSILTHKDIVVIQIVDDGLREISSDAIGVKSPAQILVNIEAVLALKTLVRDLRPEVDGAGAKAGVPLKCVAFPSSNGSVGGANVEVRIIICAWLGKHAIKRVSLPVANQIVGGRLEIMLMLINIF